MDSHTIKNKLITYMNYSKLKKELINEIQNSLLTKTKPEDFERLLQKVEKELGVKENN
ncbi:MAG TPA: hypothetical protein PLO89_10305 [Spirochaetota bacterium]|nr:hypothetical protein [Spirochaetota bacterium]